MVGGQAEDMTKPAGSGLALCHGDLLGPPDDLDGSERSTVKTIYFGSQTVTQSPRNRAVEQDGQY